MFRLIFNWIYYSFISRLSNFSINNNLIKPKLSNKTLLTLKSSRLVYLSHNQSLDHSIISSSVLTYKTNITK